MNTFNCRVYYEDTDVAGIVYYANYLKFIERARTETLRQLGVSQSVLRGKYDLIFVVSKIYAEYIMPARLDDLLEISTVFHKIKRVSFELEQGIMVKKNMIFNARVKIGILNAEGRPKQLPSVFRHKIINLNK